MIYSQTSLIFCAVYTLVFRQNPEKKINKLLLKVYTRQRFLQKWLYQLSFYAWSGLFTGAQFQQKKGSTFSAQDAKKSLKFFLIHVASFNCTLYSSPMSIIFQVQTFIVSVSLNLQCKKTRKWVNHSNLNSETQRRNWNWMHFFSKWYIFLRFFFCFHL